jgi:amicyanin
MLRHRPRGPATLSAAAVSAAAVLLISGCSGSSTPSNAPPSINYGSQASATPGMAGQGTPNAPAGSPAATPSATGPAPAPQPGTAVTIKDFKFNPATLTVPVGTTVSWTNQDEEPHSVVAKDGSFHSPGLDTNGTYSFTFANPGTYDYVCGIHPFMTASVVVTK